MSEYLDLCEHLTPQIEKVMGIHLCGCKESDYFNKRCISTSDPKPGFISETQTNASIYSGEIPEECKEKIDLIKKEELSDKL